MSRAHRGSIGPRRIGVAVVLLTLMARLGFAQGGVAPPQDPLAPAKAALDSGQFATAESIYARVAASAPDAATRGAAYFGHAYAVQRRLLAATDSLSATDAKAISEDYRRAGTLQRRLASDAASNGAAALQSAGLTSEAIRFLHEMTPFAQARGGEDRRVYDAPTLLRIAKLYESRDMTDSARFYYAAAARRDTSSIDALRARLEFSARSGAADTLLGVSARLVARPAAAAIAEHALLTYLETHRQAGRVTDSSLVLCARAWAVMGLGPASFALSEAARLRQIAAANPATRPNLDPVFDAYRPRGAGETYRDPGGWWHANRNVSRLAAWSRMLRSLGDSYIGAGDSLVAASFYEAAVGFPNPRFEESWIDLDALLPLALLYTQRAEGRGRADELVQRVQELTDMLFYGKMRAIEAGDFQRIRYFHMTLGALFAAQEQWGNGPRGAIYQFENMRRMTAKVNETKHTGIAPSPALTDPPELLEKLALGYQATNKPDSARAIATEVVAAYRQIGRPADAARVARRFNIVERPR